MAVINHSDDYDIHELYDKNANIYHLCIPSSNEMKYRVFLGFHNNINNLEEVKNIYSKFGGKDIIYIHLSIDNEILNEAANENDNKLYFELFETIRTTLHDAYQFIIKEKLAEIDQVITALGQTKNDTKFIDWLELKCGGYIKSIPLTNIANLSYMEDDNIDDVPISASDGGGNTISGDDGNEIEINKGFTKKKSPKNKHHSGNIKTVMLMFIMALVFEIVFLVLMLKK